MIWPLRAGKNISSDGEIGRWGDGEMGREGEFEKWRKGN
jgi:hypothetical protein